MKRVLAMLMSLTLLFGMMTVNVMADDGVTNADVAQAIVDGFDDWDEDTRTQFYESVVLYRSLSSQSSFFNVLYDDFVILSANYGYDFSNNTYKLLFKAILDNMLIDTTSTSYITDAELQAYLGVDDGSVDTQALYDFLMNDELIQDVFDMLVDMGYAVQNLGKGITVIDTGLDLIEATVADRGLNNDQGLSFPLFIVDTIDATEDVVFGETLITDESLTTVFVDHLNDVAGKEIVQDDDNALAQVEAFASFYNGLDDDDKRLLYTFLTDYGYIKADVTTVNGGTTTITISTGGSSSSSSTETVITITGNTIIPLSGFPSFSDLGDHLWAQEAIERLFMFFITNGTELPTFTESDIDVEMIVDEEVVTVTYHIRNYDGITQGIYEPAANMSRASMAAMILRIMGDEVQTGLTNGYTDVPADAWFTDELLTAIQLGYLDGVSGITETSVNPLDDVSREDIAIMIGNILAIKGETLTAEDSASLGLFNDSADITPGVEDQLALTVSRNILQGMVIDGQLFMMPQSSATRAEVAVMLYRLSDVVETEVYVNPPAEEEEVSE